MSQNVPSALYSPSLLLPILTHIVEGKKRNFLLQEAFDVDLGIVVYETAQTSVNIGLLRLLDKSLLPLARLDIKSY